MSGTGWHLGTSFCCYTVLLSVPFWGLSIVKCAVLTSVRVPLTDLASVCRWPSGKITWHQPTFFKAPEGRLQSLLSSVSVTTYLAGQPLSGCCSNPPVTHGHDSIGPCLTCHATYPSLPAPGIPVPMSTAFLIRVHGQLGATSLLFILPHFLPSFLFALIPAFLGFYSQYRVSKYVPLAQFHRHIRHIEFKGFGSGAELWV